MSSRSPPPTTKPPPPPPLVEVDELRLCVDEEELKPHDDEDEYPLVVVSNRLVARAALRFSDDDDDDNDEDRRDFDCCCCCCCFDDEWSMLMCKWIVLGVSVTWSCWFCMGSSIWSFIERPAAVDDDEDPFTTFDRFISKILAFAHKKKPPRTRVPFFSLSIYSLLILFLYLFRTLNKKHVEKSHKINNFLK